MYRVSEEIMCQARINIEQRENEISSRMFELQGSKQVYNSQLFISERAHCVEKPTKYETTTSSGPTIKNPCGLLWVPTKNRTGSMPCPRPDGGELQYIDHPVCKSTPAKHDTDFCSVFK